MFLRLKLGVLLNRLFKMFEIDFAISRGMMVWGSEIDEHLNTADIILLLVSSDFIDSDYCYDVEMKRALKRHEAEDARVIPIILRPVD